MRGAACDPGRRRLGLLTGGTVVVDGSKFKAVNNRDRNSIQAKMARRLAQIEESIARYLQQLDSADRQEPSEAILSRGSRRRPGQRPRAAWRRCSC